MIVLIDKEKGVTSFDVVSKVRKITGIKRVGHGGTLDPNATGLLIVAIGREDTPKLGDISKNTTKIYLTEIILGEKRDTDDIEGKIVSENKNIIPTQDQINEVLSKFVGEMEQIPPIYSAIKMNGRKAYDIARAGGIVQMKSRQVVIHKIYDVFYLYPKLVFRVEVSSGTYIRSLARDIGNELGTYGYLNNLRREKIGEYELKDALSILEFEEKTRKMAKS